MTPPTLLNIADEAYATLTATVVQRALSLQVEALGAGRFRVYGGAQPHYLDLYDADHRRCDCEDHAWRERICKHLAAVLILLGDYRMWCKLRDLLEQAEKTDA